MGCIGILYVPKVTVPILTFNVPEQAVPKKRTESVCTETVMYRKRPTPTTQRATTDAGEKHLNVCIYLVSTATVQ